MGRFGGKVNGARPLLAALVVIVGTVTAGPGRPAWAATRQADIRNSQFPEQIRIARGDTVRWTNYDDSTHTVTADSGSEERFDSGGLGTDDTFAHTFRETGVFRYHCNRHDEMRGSVEVSAPETTTTTAPPTTTTTAPPTTTTTAPPTTTTAPPTTTTTAPPTTTTAPPPPTTAPPPPPPAAPEPEVTPDRSPSSGPAPALTSTTTAREEAPATTGEASSDAGRPPETSTSTVPADGAEPATATTSPAGGGPAGPPANVGPSTGPSERARPAAGDDEEATMNAEEASTDRGGDGGGFDPGAAALVAVMFASGTFGLWSLWKLRPGQR